MVATCWSRKRPSGFLRARDFLAALLLLRWHLTERVPPRGHTPWIHGVSLRRRRPGRRRSLIARAGRGAVQRSGRRGGAPCGADEFGDTVEPFFVDVVDGTLAQELVCRDECSPSLHGRAKRAGRRTSWVSEGVAVRPPCRMDGCWDDACRSSPAGPVAALTAGDGERRGCPPTGAVWATREASAARRSARARRASDMGVTVGGERGGGRRIPVHPLRGAPKMSWWNTITYGAIDPFWFDKG